MDSPVLDEADLALEKAQESGQRVEIESKRSEHASVFANPDGFTFTLEQHTVPVRVAQPGGGWQTPDATLERREDGTIGPKAATAEMSFSGGGTTAPLVEIVDRGRSLQLDWPGELPVPEIDGVNAVYRNVLPDVDLKMTATVESFQQVLVVNTPEAAANPALKELTFGLKAEALTVREGEAGNLAAVDSSGNTVFRAPPARMWDSAGRVDEVPAVTPQLVRRASGAAEETPPPADPSEQAPSGTGLQPGQGDNLARMDVEVTAQALTVVPDAGMLSGTAAEDYPVFIDPPVTWGESERTLLRNDGYESYGWGNGDDERGQGVGECGSWNGYYCGPGYIQRLYFEFAPDNLKGKQVLDATFAVTEPWSFQCDPRQVDLVRTNNISTATTWASRPAELDWMADLWVSAGRGSLCDPDSPDAPIEFNDNPQEPNENLTPTVQAFAAGKFARLTLELRAGSETDTSAWKRFRNDAVLRVLYVAKPATPTNVGIVSGSSRICDTNGADPTILDSPQPTFTATPQTAPGGEDQAKLRTWMRLEYWVSDGVWSGSGMASPSTSTVPDNWKTTALWPTKLVEGRLYRYSAATQVFTDANAQASASGYAPWCYFMVDATAPKAPIVTFGSPYKPCPDPNSCPFYGAPGVPGTVSFKPAASDTVVSYHYRLSNGYWAEVAGSTATVTIKPPAAGTYTLLVRAEDPQGRWGTQAAHDFRVAKGADPVGRWQFTAETSGAALDNAPDGGLSHATLYGAVTRDNRGRRGVITHDKDGELLDPQEVDRGLSLGGTTGYASTAGPVVTTGSSYTISAWVRLEDGSQNQTALSQDGTMTGGWYSAFYLGYRSESGKWEIRTSPKDATDGNLTTQFVQSKELATLGVWTHLAAVYDATNTEITLYVNGKLQGTDQVDPSWTSTGKFQIGRAWWRGAYYDHWKGSIDEVNVWQSKVDASDILDEARALLPGGFNAAELVADWSPGGASGTTVADTSSGYGKVLTLAGGATGDGEDLVFDGVDDSATYKGPLVDDTGSFTVTTQVALDKSKISAKSVGYVGQVLGQRTPDGSAWGLWYEAAGTKPGPVEITLPDGTKDRVEKEVPVGYWHFGRLNTDGTFSSVRSEKESELDTPVRLTGVYDAQDGTISLRVGTTLDAVPKTFTAKLGTGELTLAKGLSAGTWKHFLAARVSDIRVWSGAVHNETQINALIAS